MQRDLAFLGLDERADERAIKRAYARLLRDARPDIDPAGFQRLNDAYRAALDGLHQREASPSTPHAGEPAAQAPHATAEGRTAGAVNDDGSPAPPQPASMAWDAGAHPTAPPPPVSVQPTEPSAFAEAAFLHELAQRAAEGDAAALHEWLSDLPALWSLAAKARVSRSVLAAFEQDALPLPEECFDVVAAFFGLDRDFALLHPFQLQALRTSADAAWYLREPRIASATPKEQAETFLAWHQREIARGRFLRTFRRRDAFLHALPPGRPRSLARFLESLSPQQRDTLAARGDARWIAFWQRCGGGRMTASRLTLGFLRCTLLALVFAALLAPLALKHGTALAPFVFQLGVGIFAPWLVWVVGYALGEWQTRTQDDPPGLAACLRLSFVPLLVLAALTLRNIPPPATPQLAGVLLLAANLLALARYVARILFVPMPHDRYLWFVLGFATLSGVLVPISGLDLMQGFGATAVVTWAADAWKHRAQLRTWRREWASPAPTSDLR